MIPFDTAHRNSATFGMLLIVLVQIHDEEIIKTVLLAGIGGTASYLFTLGLKYVLDYFRKRLK
jgi:hypothetical protein